MGTSLQAALQEHANGLVFLLVVLSKSLDLGGLCGQQECRLMIMYYAGIGPCLYDCDHGRSGQVIYSILATDKKISFCHS